MDISELNGRTLVGLDREAAPANWLFRFGANCWINIECVWRVVKEGSVVITSADHGQLYGRRDPVDVISEVDALLRGAIVRSASLADQTGDLEVEFENGARLESFTDSTGYEGATSRLETGRQLVVLGGGSIAEF